MNRKNLTAAVLAGLAGAAGIVGSAQAVNINPDGLGQVLVYPYYTVNGGNATLLSVVNTSDDAKAVKVRFMEGQNSREVLDFNLYMSMYDVWTAALSKNAEGTPVMTTADSTCTVPYIYDPLVGVGQQEFLPYAMTDEAGYDPADITTLGDISRATEGHFEMIEMGTLIDNTETSASDATHNTSGLLKGMPADCAALVRAWTQTDSDDDSTKGYWLRAPLTDLTAPSGGLFGGASIVNVQDGTMFSYDAKAINGFATSVSANDRLHQEPGTVLPSLNSGNVYVGNVFMSNGTPLTSPSLSRPVDAVSFVFMHDQIMNEYTTEVSVNAGTEWVMSFPTKQFYVYADSITGGLVPPVAPFTSEWDPEYSNEAACELVMIDELWDREEQTIIEVDEPGTVIPPIVSPAPPGVTPDPRPEIPIELCYEVSVLEFGDGADIGPTPKIALPSAILGSSNKHLIDNTLVGFDKGWMRIDLTGWAYDIDGDGDIDPDPLTGETGERDPLGGLYGLPITGFAVQRFDNGFLGEGGNTMAHYGGIFQHKATRTTESAGAADL